MGSDDGRDAEERVDYYEVLGVSPDAETAVIRRAYRRIARRLHPGMRPVDPETEERFRSAAEAWAVLSDPAKRRTYDRGGDPEVDLDIPTGLFRGPAAILEEVQELRAEIFGREARREEEETGTKSDLTAEVVLDPADALRGATTSVALRRLRLCPDCRGEGGEGCRRCAGRGRLVHRQAIRVRIPPGIGDGTRLRVKGKGHDLGGGPGDLFLVVRVPPHPYFRRKGSDVYTEVPVTLGEAFFGSEIEIGTVDGPVTVELPPGTRSGQRLRLRGRGFPLPGAKQRGDHFARISVAVPSGLDAESRRLLRRIREPNPRRGLPRGIEDD